MMRKSSFSIELRPAGISDIRLVYSFQIKKEVRQYSINSKAPSWKEHLEWMTKKLNSDCDYFYIVDRCCLNSKTRLSVGVLRLDYIEDNEFYISIYFNPNEFGKGYGGRALKEINRLHPSCHIVATILEKNLVSRRLFESNGYVSLSKTKFIRKPIIDDGVRFE